MWPFREYSLEDLDFDLREALGLYRVLDEEGNPLPGRDPELDEGLLMDMYTFMVRARLLDEWLLRLQRAGKVAIHAPNRGQEAVTVGAAMALEREDWLFPSYRELGALLVRGMSEEEIFDRAMANRDDPLKGSDFAIYGNREYNIVPAPVPVGNHVPHATGVAYAIKYLGHRRVVMAFFGDGATSRGDFHAGLNFAGVFKVPAVYVIQNNQWAISVPITRQTASKTLALKGIAYNVRSVRVDGNDAIAVYLKAREAVERARRGEGPTLIEAVTYRLGPHTTADDPARYRSPEEVEVFEKLDPLKRMRNYLIKRRVLSVDEDKNMWREWGERLADLARKCFNKPGLPEEVILEDVYSEPTWNIAEQLEELRESLKLMRELGAGVEE